MTAAADQFSNAYYKAHRLYGFAAGLLLVLELIGIEESDAAQIPYTSYNLSNPNALPVVVAIGVLYFAFRLTVEWYQQSEGLRSRRASVLDFCLMHVAASSAIGVMLLQRVFGIDTLGLVTFSTYFAVAVFLTAVGFVALLSSVPRLRTRAAFWIVGTSSLLAATLAVYRSKAMRVFEPGVYEPGVYQSGENYWLVLAGTVAGTAAGGLLVGFTYGAITTALNRLFRRPNGSKDTGG